MAFLQEFPIWEEGIYQYEEDDPLQPGADGIDNLQGKQLGNRTQYLKKSSDALRSEMAEGEGRNLLDVLGVPAISAAMAEIRRRCNNNGEIDNTKIPDFRGLMISDYIDGIDLSGLTPTTGGTAPQAWNNTYKNNRIIVAGFNTYKSMGGNSESNKTIFCLLLEIASAG